MALQAGDEVGERDLLVGRLAERRLVAHQALELQADVGRARLRAVLRGRNVHFVPASCVDRTGRVGRLGFRCAFVKCGISVDFENMQTGLSEQQEGHGP